MNLAFGLIFFSKLMVVGVPLVIGLVVLRLAEMVPRLLGEHAPVLHLAEMAHIAWVVLLPIDVVPMGTVLCHLQHHHQVSMLFTAMGVEKNMWFYSILFNGF